MKRFDFFFSPEPHRRIPSPNHKKPGMVRQRAYRLQPALRRSQPAYSLPRFAQRQRNGRGSVKEPKPPAPIRLKTLCCAPSTRHGTTRLPAGSSPWLTPRLFYHIKDGILSCVEFSDAFCSLLPPRSRPRLRTKKTVQASFLVADDRRSHVPLDGCTTSKPQRSHVRAYICFDNSPAPKYPNWAFKKLVILLCKVATLFSSPFLFFLPVFLFPLFRDQHVLDAWQKPQSYVYHGRLDDVEPCRQPEGVRQPGNLCELGDPTEPWGAGRRFSRTSFGFFRRDRGVPLPSEGWRPSLSIKVDDP